MDTSLISSPVSKGTLPTISLWKILPQAFYPLSRRGVTRRGDMLKLSALSYSLVLCCHLPFI